MAMDDMSAPEAETPETPRRGEVLARRAAKAAHANDDPMEFFRPTSTTEAVASYAKGEALRVMAPSLARAWAKAARLPLALWAVLPPLVAGAWLVALQLPVKWDRLIATAVVAALALLGVNLLRLSARQVAPARPSFTLLLAAPEGRVGSVILGLATIGGLVMTRWLHGSSVALGFLGLVIAVAYAIGPFLFAAALPGEEVLPPLALGPVVFFLALATQPAIIPKTEAHAVVANEWLLAIALALPIFAAILVERLSDPASPPAMSLRALVRDGGVRLLVVLSWIGAFALALFAGVHKGLPHASIATLLALPVALIPITGVVRAKTAKAAAVLVPESSRAILAFSGWLAGGLLLGGVYLHLLTTIHALFKK
jgi:hypothetical protein